MLASCTVEADQIAELYGADPDRIRVVPPGVDHAFFGPGDRPQARRALGLPPDGTLLLFVGRIQPLKGAGRGGRGAGRPDPGRGGHYRLVVVGGPSGPRGADAYAALSAEADRLGVADRLTLVDPQPHELLSSYYRAADACLVPSRSESFGLVALEAAACGTPVVASAVGGLTTLVDDGRTGVLVEDHRDPGAFADAVRRLAAEPLLAERMSTGVGAAGPGLHVAGGGGPAAPDPRRAGVGPAGRVPLTALGAVPLVDLPDEEEMAAAAAAVDRWLARERAAEGAAWWPPSARR